jgi:hypothetical protein
VSSQQSPFAKVRFSGKYKPVYPMVVVYATSGVLLVSQERPGAGVGILWSADGFGDVFTPVLKGIAFIAVRAPPFPTHPHTCTCSPHPHGQPHHRRAHSYRVCGLDDLHGRQYVYPPAFDVSPVRSVDGAYVATVIGNATATTTARTFISWNLGGAWQPARTVAALEGLVRPRPSTHAPPLPPCPRLRTHARVYVRVYVRLSLCAFDEDRRTTRTIHWCCLGRRTHFTRPRTMVFMRRSLHPATFSPSVRGRASETKGAAAGSRAKEGD